MIRARRFHLNLALCLLTMTVAGALVLAWLGWSWMTAVAVAIAVACPVTALYAWWLSKRTSQMLDRAGSSGTRSRI
jgi:Kef-type K+ transport system membrane component KefB